MICLQRLVVIAFGLSLFCAGVGVAQEADSVSLDRPTKELRRAHKEVESAMKRGNEQLVASAIRALAEHRAAGTIEYFLSLNNTKSEVVYQTMRESLASTFDADFDAEYLAAYETASKSKSKTAWHDKIMLIDAVAEHGTEASQTILAQAVTDAHPKVRLAAIRALQAHATPDDHDWLVHAAIQSLATEEKHLDIGTPHRTGRSTLVKVTGFDHPSAQKWADFWIKHKEQFDPAKDRGATQEISSDTGIEYYAQPVTSHRVLFIIDLSNSMRRWDHEGWTDKPNHEPKGTGGNGTERRLGRLTDPDWLKWLDDNPSAIRINRAKLELASIIADLPPTAKFNIIAYSSSCTAWQTGLVFANDKHQAAAKKFIDKLEPRGETRTDLAIAKIFRENLEADTVYFLSDGRPTNDRGVDIDFNPILDAVQHLNRFPRLTIQCLGFGEGAAQFLEPLAEQNAGQYRQILGPPDLKQK